MLIVVFWGLVLLILILEVFVRVFFYEFYYAKLMIIKCKCGIRWFKYILVLWWLVKVNDELINVKVVNVFWYDVNGLSWYDVILVCKLKWYGRVKYVWYVGIII